MTATLRIDPLTPAIGAEVLGVDLTKPLDEQTFNAIYGALMEYLVIFFRDQDISPALHENFAAGFGELKSNHPVYAQVPGHRQIVLLENDLERPPDTNDWHTDLTFMRSPPFASILHAQVVPPTGGDTLWASMYAAYDALPDGVKADIQNLEAVHDMGSFRNDYLVNGSVKELNDAMAEVGSALHPLLYHHPVTGRPALYVNKSFTRHIVGFSTTESDRLLNYLFDHIECPEFQVRFRWRNNSIAMWDNRVTQHYAVADYMPHYRCMHRITVVDDKRARPTELVRQGFAG